MYSVDFEQTFQLWEQKGTWANFYEYRACLSIGICFSAKIWWNEITL
jgi:hypothetical protein